MMISEFIERTGYEPDAREYRAIERAYYDFNGDKNAFCAHWLKEKKAGRWTREYYLLSQIEYLEDEKEQDEKRHREEISELEIYYKIQLEQYEAREEKLKKQLQKYEEEKRIRENGDALLKKFLTCGA